MDSSKKKAITVWPKLDWLVIGHRCTVEVLCTRSNESPSPQKDKNFLAMLVVISL